MSTATFLKTCDSCAMTNINGYRCHETGCPAAWKDQKKACFICGFDFQPQSRHDRICQDCRHERNDPQEKD